MRLLAGPQAVIGRPFDRPSLTLAHGRAGLSVDFRDVAQSRTPGDEVTCAPWLANDRRRPLLADVGIGTIDQALPAVLRARFLTLRLWGLSSKILIVDEAHEISGDAYMGGLLAVLLRAHAAQGGAGNRTSMRGGGPMVTLVDPGTGSLRDLVPANTPNGRPACRTEAGERPIRQATTRPRRSSACLAGCGWWNSRAR